jgi:hypothetical protein
VYVFPKPSVILHSAIGVVSQTPGIIVETEVVVKKYRQHFS